jgi:hypothetical protein
MYRNGCIMSEFFMHDNPLLRRHLTDQDHDTTADALLVLIPYLSGRMHCCPKASLQRWPW